MLFENQYPLLNGGPMKSTFIRTTSCLLTATALTFIALPANAQFQKPEDAVKFRKSALSLIGTYMGRMGAVVKGEAPYNKDDFAKNAALINTLSGLPWQGFGPGTESERALPAIWSDNAKFKAASEKFQTAAAELNKAAQSGNIDTIKTAFAATGKTCSACHDDFRKK
jgi:cytochrome c556